MKSKVKAALFGAFVVSSMCLFSPELAQAGRGEKWAKMAEELSFTPEQRDKLKKIQEDFHKTLPAKRDAMETAREELQTALKGSASDDEIRKKFQALEAAQSDFAKSRFEKVLAIRGILTPDQRAKFKEDFSDKRHEKRGRKHRFKGGSSEEAE